ncbi:hypothetical protein HC229_15855 [Flavobacterium sp. D33]|nr:hypothetical protein [Flavobacterium selenitireducens]
MKAQTTVANYGFSQSTSTYSALTTYTNLFTANWDDATPTQVTLPFTFSFRQNNYNSVWVNANGYITFGATSVNDSYGPISSTTGYAGAVSAFARDLTNNGTQIRWGTLGASPNRIFVVQWTDARRYDNTTIRNGNFSFQIRLYETSNAVQVVYGPNNNVATQTLGVQVGLRGANNADFNNRLLAAGGNWNSTSAGAANSATCVTNNTTVPASGLTFTWRPRPVVSSFLPTSFCQNQTGNVVISGYNFTAATSVTFNGTSVSFAVDNDNQITASLPTGISSGNIAVTTTPQGTGTSSSSFTINPLPTVAAITGNNPVCISTTNTLSNATPGGTWTSLNTGIATVNPTTGLVTGVAPGSATIRYTVTNGNGCSNFAATTVVVNAPPSLSGPSSVCPGSTVNLSPSTGGTWTSSNNAIASITNAGVVTGNIPGNVTFTFTNSTTLCSATTATFTVLQPIAITSDPSPVSVCSAGSASFSAVATGAGLSYQWFHGATPLANGGNISGANLATLNLTNIAVSDAGNYHVVVSGSCGSPLTSANALLSVTQRVTIANQPAVTQTHCETETATFTVNATGAGLSYQWFNGGTSLTDSGNISGATTPTLTISPLNLSDASTLYHVVVSGISPCNPVTSDMATLIVNEAPSITTQPLATQSVCDGGTVSFSVAADGGDLTYQWFNGSTPLANAGNISGANTPTLTINPATMASASNYHVVITNGCGTGVTSADAALTVNPTAFIGNQTASLCSGSTLDFAPVNAVPTPATVVPSGTLYTWSAPIVTGGMTGGVAETIPQTSIIQSLDNPTIAPQTATYTVTPHTGGCTGPTFTLTVTVNPAAVIGNPPNQIACSGTTFSFTPSNGGGNVVPVGTTYTWGLPVISPAGSVTGATAGAAQLSLSQTLTNTSGVNGQAVYTVTAASGTCNESTFTVIFTVRPTPTVAGAPLTQSICSGAGIGAISITNPNAVPGTITYSWTRDQVGIVNGSIGSSGFGATINGTLTNTTTDPVVVTFTLIATSPFGCPSAPQTVSVTVNPALGVSATPSTQTICSEDAISTIVLANTNGVTGAALNWTRNNTANVIGIPDFGSGDISGTLVNTTSTAQSVVFTITPAANSCNGNPVNVTVIVRPKPTISFSATPGTICSGGSITPAVTIHNPNLINGRTFSWTRDNNANVSGPDSGANHIISGTFVNNTNVAQIVTFTATITAGTCSTFATFQMTVEPRPVIVINSIPATAFCNGGTLPTINLSATNIPISGLSWTRDRQTQVTGIANSGTNTIPTGTLTNTTTTTQIVTFTVTAAGANGCNTTSTFTVTVNPTLRAPAITSSQTVCLLSTPNFLSQSVPVGGGSGSYTYQWQRSNDGTTGWAAAPGINNGPTYQPAGIPLFGAQNYYYRLLVTDTCGSVTSTTNVYIQVVSNAGFTFNGVSDPTPRCSGGTFTTNISSEHAASSAVRYEWNADPAFITPATGGPIGTTSNPIFWIFRVSSASLPFTVQNNTNATVVTPVSIIPSVYDIAQPGNSAGDFQCSITPQVVDVTIRPVPVATISSPANNATICATGATTSIVVNGNITDAPMSYTVTRTPNTLPSGLTATATPSPGLTNVPAGTPLNYNVVFSNTTGLTQTITYTFTPRGSYASGPTCAGAPVSITLQIAPNVGAGSILASQNICLGQDATTITSTAPGTGLNISYQWYSSTTSATGPWDLVPFATGVTFTPLAGNITQTTWFYRETISVVNGVTCSSASSNVHAANVYTVDPGAVAGEQTICPGQTPAPFTVTTPASGTAPIAFRWYSSTSANACTNPGATWNMINGAPGAAEAYAPGPLSQTTYFKRVTTPGTSISACANESICIVVYVNTITAGSVGNNHTVCQGGDPDAFVELTPAVGAGTITYQWQSNTTSCAVGSPWADIPGAVSATYDAFSITSTTYFRRLAYSTLNGVTCGPAISGCVTVTLNPVTAGMIGPNRTICAGGDPAAIGFTTAPTGTALTYQWQSSPDILGPFTDIPGPGTTGNSYNPPVTTQTTYYQVVVTGTSGASTCPIVSNTVSVFVNDITPAIIAGDQNMCVGEMPTALTMPTLATGSGTITYQWQSSPTGAAPWTNVGTGTSFSPGTVTQTLYYQVVCSSTISPLGCNANSNMIVVSSNGKTWNGSAGTNWNNAANWTPNGVPTAANCVVIPDVANNPVISGSNYTAFALNLTILNGGYLSVDPSNTIEVTNFVNVNAGGDFFIGDDASLVQLDDVANTGTARIRRITPPVYKFDYTYWNSPVTLGSNFTLGALSPGTQPDKYYSWNPSVSGGNGNWNQESIATVMNPSKGFIVRAPNSHGSNPGAGIPYPATFVGTPNNGTMTAPITAGPLPAGTVTDKLNLIGNPYPSALDADIFLAHPTNASILDGTMYFWTHNSPPSSAYPDPFYGNFTSNYTATDYATYTLGLGGTATMPGGTAPSGKVATGQSFFIKATGNGNAVFENNMRVRGDNDVFFRPGNAFTAAIPSVEKHRIWLNLANSQGAFSQILVGYAQGATNGKDRNFDGITFAGNAVTFYSVLDETRLTIQGRALPFETSDLVPLGYKATLAATFTIGIDHLDGLFENQNVYLEDKQLNIIHDLKTSPYSFTSAIGTFNDRFVLRYTDAQLGTPDHGANQGVVAFISKDKLYAQASVDIVSIAIYDITGKKITTYEPKSDSFQKDFPYAQGVYIAKVVLSDESEHEIKLAR